MAEYFLLQFRELGAQGEIMVTADQIRVTWVTPDFKPLEAALAKLQRGQLRDGTLLLESILSRRPNDVDVLYNLGVARNEAGNPRSRSLSYADCWSLTPSTPAVGLGVALGRLGDTPGADGAFRAAVKTDATDT